MKEICRTAQIGMEEMEVTRSRGDPLIFATGFAAIAVTSFCFVLRALVADAWGGQLALSDSQKGELLIAAPAYPAQ
jgi:hypothetical protein